MTKRQLMAMLYESYRTEAEEQLRLLLVSLYGRPETKKREDINPPLFFSPLYYQKTGFYSGASLCSEPETTQMPFAARQLLD